MERAALEIERRKLKWDCRDVAESRAKGEQDVRGGGAGRRVEGRVHPFHPTGVEPVSSKHQLERRSIGLVLVPCAPAASALAVAALPSQAGDAALELKASKLVWVLFPMQRVLGCESLAALYAVSRIMN